MQWTAADVMRVVLFAILTGEISATLVLTETDGFFV